MSRTRQLGVSLLEMLLVLAIMASILGLGARFYRTYTNEISITQVGEQVANILDAMKLYYYANCAQGRTLGTTWSNPYVVLSGPSSSTPPLTYFMSQSLQTQNAMVDTSDASTYYGYIAQFNPHTSSRIPPDRTYYGDGATVVGTVISWSSQVSVKAINSAILPVLAAQLGAECVSTYKSAAQGVYACGTQPGGTPAVPPIYTYTCSWENGSGAGCGPIVTVGTDCASNTSCTSAGYTNLWSHSSYISTPGIPAIPAPSSTYVVFEQMPSYGSGHNSTNSTFMPMLKLFKQQYENSQYQGFFSPGNNVNSGGSYSTNYYFCGS